MTEASPRISVITATYNAAGQLPHTIRSLREQTSRDFEWIVVDGNSDDGTQDLLRDSGDVITRWISEPDRGIYDAFNKGANLARGEWLIFLGAGDELASPQTLAICVRELEATSKDTSLVYGRQTLISSSARTPIETFGEPWQDIKNRWSYGRPSMPPHGSSFTRRTLFAELGPFDLRFPIASDAHFFYRAARRGEPRFIPVDVSLAPVGGVSLRLDTIRRQAREVADINRDLGIVPPPKVRVSVWLRLVIAYLLSFLPWNVACRIADLLRRLAGKPPLWSVH